MKNTKNSVKSIKRALVISTAAIVICVIGIIIEFISKKTWDAAGCTMLAANSTILFCNLDAYKKAIREGKD